MPVTYIDPETEKFLAGKSTHTAHLYNHFINEFAELGDISLHATKTMIGISNGHKRIAWVTQFGKNFIHVVLPFNRPYEDNLCFSKVALVPGSNQYNHHLRILQKEDVNEEVRGYLRLTIEG
ncbi:hypothetical protein C8P68_104336 [Mucilaginibacter yixingensis]|uniref:Uncharacterized protein n=1 Tax=Mucilaginibacter yixingensis TaxID=1295612 RepID=A0A2T5J9Y2_9SPHI|nr:DUF5655 domain-containing protein [Mucilaginibacter yixingensis]PTQ96844.1 hypothetical protein C8P68_104336 [Mucilaginibacter yixingensis]